MKVEGEFLFAGIPAEAAWKYLTDAGRLVECLPGCEKLIQTAEDTYEMTMRVGIGAIRGSYTGTVRLHDLSPFTSYRMSVSGNGAAGFVNGEGTVELSPTDIGTSLRYSGDIHVGGPIASVGQRMVGAAARMVIDQFFKCVAGKLG